MLGQRWRGEGNRGDLTDLTGLGLEGVDQV